MYIQQPIRLQILKDSIQPFRSIALFSMAESTIHFPGSFCEASAITEEALLGVEDLPRLCQTDDLTNGIIYEQAEFRSRHNIHWSEVER